MRVHCCQGARLAGSVVPRTKHVSARASHSVWALHSMPLRQSVLLYLQPGDIYKQKSYLLLILISSPLVLEGYISPHFEVKTVTIKPPEP